VNAKELQNLTVKFVTVYNIWHLCICIFFYIDNILHLLQIFFVASTKKNKYLLPANNLRSVYLQMEFTVMI